MAGEPKKPDDRALAAIEKVLARVPDPAPKDPRAPSHWIANKNEKPDPDSLY